jgi:hypothetical protein
MRRFLSHRAVRTLIVAATAIVASTRMPPCSAIPIVITDPSPTYSLTVEGCPDHEWCAVNAFLDTTTVKYGDSAFNALFKKGFDNWNAVQPGGAKWTLADGGSTLAAAFGINTFDAKLLGGNTKGGVEINVDFLYAGSDRVDYWWAQGIYANYLPSGRVAPYFFMDTTDLSVCQWAVCSSPPLYPYQYTDRSFYDLPYEGFPNSFFEADAFLTKIDFNTRVLTDYEGIHYGYRLSVPEPNVLLLVFIGIVAMGYASTMRSNASQRRTK